MEDFLFKIHLSICVCRSACVCTCDIQKWPSGVLFCHSWPIPLRYGPPPTHTFGAYAFSTRLELSTPLVSACSGLGMQVCLGWPVCGCWDPNVGSQDCVASTLKHGAISPASHNGILFSHKQEQNWVICRKMFETGNHHVKWNVTLSKQAPHSYSLMCHVSYIIYVMRK